MRHAHMKSIPLRSAFPLSVIHHKVSVTCYEEKIKETVEGSSPVLSERCVCNSTYLKIRVFNYHRYYAQELNIYKVIRNP